MATSKEIDEPHKLAAADERIRDLALKDFETLLENNETDDMVCMWARTSVLYHSMAVYGYTIWESLKFKNDAIDKVTRFNLDSKVVVDAIFNIIAGLDHPNDQVVSIAEKMAPSLIVLPQKSEKSIKYKWDVVTESAQWKKQQSQYQRMLTRKSIMQNARPLELRDVTHTAATILNLDPAEFARKMDILGATLERLTVK